MAVCQDAIRVLRGLELLPEYKQYRRHVIHYFARANYRIARLYIDEDNYWQAARHFMKAVLIDPLIGLAFRKPEERGLGVMFRILKAYFAAPASLVKGVLHGRR